MSYIQIYEAPLNHLKLKLLHLLKQVVVFKIFKFSIKCETLFNRPHTYICFKRPTLRLIKPIRTIMGFYFKNYVKKKNSTLEKTLII